MAFEAIKKEGSVYTCSKCDFQTTYKDCLYVHRRAKHEGKIFQCNECLALFSYLDGNAEEH